MTQDVFELLRQKEREAKQEKRFYVYYDPSTGEIAHFRNYLENDSLPFVEITESALDVPVESFESRNYLVLEQDKKMKLVRVDNVSNHISNIDDLIHQVPKVVEQDFNYDILIEQDNRLRVFRLKLSQGMKDKFSAHRAIHQTMNIYVTAESDPNILYKTLEFKVNDLVVNDEYSIEFDDFDGKNCNLFSTKYFQNYLHVDIR